MGSLSFVIFLLVCSVVVRGQRNAPKELAASQLTEQPPSDNTTSTEIPTTTHSPTDTTTPPTTASNHTTGTPNTTISASPAPTSPIPTTPSSTVAPTSPPLPMPHAGTWDIRNSSSNATCFKMTMSAQFQFTNDVHGVKEINLEPNATSDGQCNSSKDQLLTLNWMFVNIPLKAEFHFRLENSTDKDDPRQVVVLNNLTLYLHEKAEYYLLKEELSAHVGFSYKCNSKQNAPMTSNASVTWQDVQVQAFMTSQNFASAEECTLDDTTNDIVPIAVGCALGGLVVIVLIAYVVGRRISRKKGYQSV